MTVSTSIIEATFNGEVAIVPGPASGTGLATTELLHARGAKVIAVGRSSNVEKLARPGIVPLVADAANEENSVLAVTLAKETFGKLDILVNNADNIINKPWARQSWLTAA